MADKSAIEWTDATWNPIVGCSIVSPGCTNCYAMKMAGRIERMGSGPHYAGTTQLTKAGAVWTGKVALAPDHILTQPLRWKRGRKIFVNSMGDLFHESVPDEWIDKVFAVMALAPQHTFQVLTKRAERMRGYMTALTSQRLADAVPAGSWPITKHSADAWLNESASPEHRALYRAALTPIPLPNVWLGVSAERQQEWDERTEHLRHTAAAVRFVSAEPLLGPIIASPETLRALHLIIGGGESGHDARPMHPDWPRSLRDQCAAAGVYFFFKQWGGWAPICAMKEETIDGIYHPAPERHPDATRRCKVQLHVLHADGTRHNIIEPLAFAYGTRAMTMFHVGKKVAGRLLDNREHNEFPPIPAAESLAS